MLYKTGGIVVTETYVPPPTLNPPEPAPEPPPPPKRVLPPEPSLPGYADGTYDWPCIMPDGGPWAGARGVCRVTIRGGEMVGASACRHYGLVQ